MPRRPARDFICKVVGLSYRPGYPDTVLDLADRIEKHQWDTGRPLRAYLERNPYNEHDVNAIEVWSSRTFIGHLPAHIALRLAPCLDAGEEWRATFDKVRVDPEHPDQPGVDVRVWKVEA